MKVRDRGVPDKVMWTGFFDPAKVLAISGLDQGVQDIVEFGSLAAGNSDPWRTAILLHAKHGGAAVALSEIWYLCCNTTERKSIGT